ncbi:MAG TPA: tetratricopeptide repeat protein, partial [Nitrospira sp.]|nr:tetratricopeptide repeat protein [Nitrospira sp.]
MRQARGSLGAGLRLLAVVLSVVAGLCAAFVEAEAKTGDSTPGSVLARAKQLEADKSFQEAIEAYRDYLAMQPENDEVRATLAKLLSWQGRYDEAAALYRAVLTRHPMDHDSRIGLARVLAWQKQFDASQEQYRLVLRDVPQQVEAMTGLADVLLWSGHPEQALPYYEQVLAATGDAEVAGRIRSLKADIAAASQPPPSSAEAARLLELARKLETQRRYPEAAIAYREALALRPEDDEVRAKL